ncbi:MAG: acyl-CoA dehydratase activase [Prevotellaceae bacterium]|jgi:predicted CoA-substrate-specific enzyme activase|nr:acyl-CoA dehydratase activase [Prevotellaceae bacterium]
MSKDIYSIGLDAGSTTLKLAVTNAEGNIIFTDYNRHHANITQALTESLRKAENALGNVHACIQTTGSAGMGISERFGLPFIQEVVAATLVVQKQFPETRTLIDIGGEDSKMIFFNHKMQADIRMNGNCAGGTGSFIDQMANILGVSVSDLSDMALHSDSSYPIASRCGVFSKTDIQNLISLNVKREDIAASIFQAVATQVISSLSRGCDISPKVFLCGGPFAFIPALRNVFKEKLGLDDDDVILSGYASVVPAWGASLSETQTQQAKTISEYIQLFQQKNEAIEIPKSGLTPLFRNKPEKENWEYEKGKTRIEKVEIEALTDERCYIGIDSGSTTTKVVAMDSLERIFFTFYKKNGGKSLETVKEGLSVLYQKAKETGKNLQVCGSCSTGYGEDLIKTAFNLDVGMVETIAHYLAACKLNPKVSFILDIGGQDMKAIFVEKGAINRLEINEACSSGCGSFIDNFAQTLNCPIEDFVQKACLSQNPCDLGTRCTVFMNSKVKQSLREGAALGDISAGLAYSVVKNCLYKVLKLKSAGELGDHIVLQGGTMRNKAIVRAFELSSGKNVTVSNFPELMGAYGAALYAKKKTSGRESCISLSELLDSKDYISDPFRCVGCENNCRILKNTFSNGKIYYSGNKCEKVYTNKGQKLRLGFNLSLFRNELAFKKSLKRPVEKAYTTIGIPRVLNMFENFPFWYTLFTLNNIEVKSSSRSTFKMYEKGLHTVMADNICFPAKLTHGHILDLAEKRVDRIFFPYVIYEEKEPEANNSYNCPVVSGYSDVIRSAVNPEKSFGIPFDSPVINFSDTALLKKACRAYLENILKEKFSVAGFEKAFQHALEAKKTFAGTVRNRAVQTLSRAGDEKRFVILLAGRPYHNDPLIQHKISEIITSFGVDVITEDLLREDKNELSESHVIPQWSYMNRIMKAAQWVANTDQDVHFVQITSFGCGPDAFIIDEISDILKRKGKNLTLLKVDDVNNAGSLKLRIRSLIESLKFKNEIEKPHEAFETTPEFLIKDKNKTILVPYFSDFHSPFIPPAFKLMGYHMENMPPSDAQSAALGLKYANNEICYPATLVIGDCIRALQSGKYDLNNIAFAITQTGGQCRATNYIALIKKALLSAGYGDIPVVSVSIMNTINEQSGFNLDVKNGARSVIYAVLFADALSKMYYATAVREKEKGIARKLKEEYLQKGVIYIEKKDAWGLCRLLKEAAGAFNKAALEMEVPRIGIVGEIFLKYNSFGHQYVVDWLVEQGIEPVIPALSEFFTQYFPNAKFNEKHFLEHKRPLKGKLLTLLGETWMNNIEKKIDKAASAFRYYEPNGNIHLEAKKAEKIINLAAQFGEGWLIPAELASFAERNIFAAISIQPFGCIANHVVSKGIEKKVKDTYPDMNILFLDFDGGVSEVNVRNRLHFITRQVK